MNHVMVRPFSHDIDNVSGEIHITINVRTREEVTRYEFILSDNDAMALSADIERVVNEGN